MAAAVDQAALAAALFSEAAFSSSFPGSRGCLPKMAKISPQMIMKIDGKVK